MKKIFTSVVFLLIFFNAANKAFSIEADAFVQQTVSRAAKTLSSGLTKEERIQKLKEKVIFLQGFKLIKFLTVFLLLTKSKKNSLYKIYYKIS